MAKQLAARGVGPTRSRVLLHRALAWALCPALLAACGSSEGGSNGDASRPPVRVQVVAASAQPLPRTIASVGSLESPDMTTVASEVEGRVVALDVPEGRLVEEGHVLARLDDAEARAALRVTRARRKNAQDRLKRLESLRAESVSSEQTYDDAKAEFDAASAAMDEAQTRLDKTTIRAPFPGVLGLRQVNLGEYVDGGTPLVELTQVDPLELVFNIPQRFVADLAVGQKVLGVVGRCGPAFEGTVDVIDPRVDAATRSVRLQAHVPNPEGALYPGMAVSLQLVVGEITDAIVVPQEAVVRQGTRHVVYTVDAENRAEMHTVTLGSFFADGVHVRAGIAPGARVVAAGQQKLRPGAPTEPLPFEATDNPNLALGRGAAGCREGV
ncbi:MAG: efflux RND transporter periplasmic adaptor subunit [Myxococcota bacterium]|nr:efflux RND transporter periplasmic adaptor subunit [Myxococcota bacterium]